MDTFNEDTAKARQFLALSIFLKFIGKFEALMPESTAKELAEQEKQRQHRAYYRGKPRRYAGRKKQRE